MTKNFAEVADLTRGAAVRGSENPAKGHIPFPAAEWDTFLAITRADQPWSTNHHPPSAPYVYRPCGDSTATSGIWSPWPR